MWERRYGYPKPERDADGDRVYTDADVHKLTLIRQLMEQGKRPGKLISMPVSGLEKLYQEGLGAETAALAQLVPLLQAADLPTLQSWLENRLSSQGLARFVCQTLPVLNQAVGDAWEHSQIGVSEEHLYSEQINNLLRQSINKLPSGQQPPRVLLTTVPGEQHSLGLLMVEALLRLAGCQTIPMGPDMPYQEIIRSANQHNVHVVALSFSLAFPTTDALIALSGLRPNLPDHIEIWAGGGSLQGDIALPAGIHHIPSLLAVDERVTEWRRNAALPAANH